MESGGFDTTTIRHLIPSCRHQLSSIALSKSKKVVFDFAVVDEAQDIGPAHLRFLAALVLKNAPTIFIIQDMLKRGRDTL